MSRIMQTSETSLTDLMLDMGKRARAASQRLSHLTAKDRSRGLLAMADALETSQGEILKSNALDMQQAKQKQLSDAMLDRLLLTPERMRAMADAVRMIAGLEDPVGQTIANWTVPSGLDISRVRTPLGVIGIIYESRPNVTADASALCLRSGNAAILRAGSESLNSALAIATALRSGLDGAGLPADALQLVGTPEREAVGHMLTGLDGNLDVVVPRGGKGLVERVQKDARVPVIGHLEGLCHIYIDADADPQKAVDIAFNAKMRRTGVCGAMETLLINEAIAPRLLPAIAAPLREAGCELRGDTLAKELLPDMILATEEDWRTEYLAPILSIKVVKNLDGALAHIARYGTGHTEAIVTENTSTADRFLNEVDAAIALHNASTQFADGGEFGMGAEIGIATGRIHARGPVGAEQLTTFKYVVRGTGQTRP
ncbi:glutamate-5-semialdehyde dehydrogenase [Henriciella barbarensis]|uniref:Gamma-glutamyl phosphate reductase n=1 Tax=Henriciella barbarensis TaxID=86342 RepID=A0A399QT83_9PROT|nr:glutamate-5-semialdehyde dehydrogenase [Henriciella barbarensis]RIJ21395.1 glutamate-5-semialdehyde dehydrogenase [Henriciella barbarensis]